MRTNDLYRGRQNKAQIHSSYLFVCIEQSNSQVRLFKVSVWSRLFPESTAADEYLFFIPKGATGAQLSSKYAPLGSALDSLVGSSHLGSSIRRAPFKTNWPAWINLLSLCVKCYNVNAWKSKEIDSPARQPTKKATRSGPWPLPPRTGASHPQFSPVDQELGLWNNLKRLPIWTCQESVHVARRPKDDMTTIPNGLQSGNHSRSLILSELRELRVKNSEYMLEQYHCKDHLNGDSA